MSSLVVESEYSAPVICTVCQELLTGTGQEVVTTQCGHGFHKECLNAWFVKNPANPVRRINVSLKGYCPCCSQVQSLNKCVQIFLSVDEEEESMLKASVLRMTGELSNAKQEKERLEKLVAEKEKGANDQNALIEAQRVLIATYSDTNRQLNLKLESVKEVKKPATKSVACQASMETDPEMNKSPKKKTTATAGKKITATDLSTAVSAVKLGVLEKKAAVGKLSAAKPLAAKPSATKPSATKPSATKPSATKPSATTKPSAVKSTATKKTPAVKSTTTAAASKMVRPTTKPDVARSSTTSRFSLAASSASYAAFTNRFSRPVSVTPASAMKRGANVALGDLLIATYPKTTKTTKA